MNGFHKAVRLADSITSVKDAVNCCQKLLEQFDIADQVETDELRQTLARAELTAPEAVVAKAIIENTADKVKLMQLCNANKKSSTI